MIKDLRLPQMCLMSLIHDMGWVCWSMSYFKVFASSRKISNWFCTCHSLHSRQSIKGWKLTWCRPRLHIETGFYHSSIPVVPRVLGRPVGLPVGLPVWLPVELPVERPVEIPVGLPVEPPIIWVGLTASHTILNGSRDFEETILLFFVYSVVL